MGDCGEWNGSGGLGRLPEDYGGRGNCAATGTVTKVGLPLREKIFLGSSDPLKKLAATIRGGSLIFFY